MDVMLVIIILIMCISLCIIANGSWVDKRSVKNRLADKERELDYVSRKIELFITGSWNEKTSRTLRNLMIVRDTIIRDIEELKSKIK